MSRTTFDMSRTTVGRVARPLIVLDQKCSVHLVNIRPASSSPRIARLLIVLDLKCSVHLVNIRPTPSRRIAGLLTVHSCLLCHKEGEGEKACLTKRIHIRQTCLPVCFCLLAQSSFMKDLPARLFLFSHTKIAI